MKKQKEKRKKTEKERKNVGKNPKNNFRKNFASLEKLSQKKKKARFQFQF